MRRIIFFGVLVLFLAAFVFGPVANVETAEAQKVITWKSQSHWPMASSSYRDSLVAVAERIKERSNGRLVIEPHPGGALVPGPQVFTAVKQGMLPIGVTSSAYDLAEVPIFNVVAGLPLNFATEWEGVYFHQWMGFEQMVKDYVLENHDMLFFTDKIYTTELSLKKPVRTFEDFKGLKLRSSGILQKYLTSIGAAASMIPGGDIYAALASGMMDGAHWGAVQGSYSMKFYEISKYHLRPALNVAATDIWLVNKKAFDKLPEDLQEILVSTLEEHFWLRTNQYIYLESLVLSKIQREDNVTLITLPPEEYAKMQKAALKIWDDVAALSPECAEAVEMVKEFNRKMGRLE